MIAGRQFWPSRAVDDEAEVIDLLVQRTREDCRREVRNAPSAGFRPLRLNGAPARSRRRHPQLPAKSASFAVEMHGKRQNRRPHRVGDLARKFEARRRQLHIGVGEFDDRMEQRRQQWANAQDIQRLVQTKQRRLIDGLVKLPRDVRVLMPLLLRRRRRQAEEVRRAVLPRQMQKRCTAESDGRSL